MKDIIEMSEGNPGALVCLLDMFKFEKQEELLYGINIISTLKKYEIKGTDIYVLWNDLSNKNYEMMSMLCERVPRNELIEACSKQDYSGREIVKPYIIEINK